MLQTGRSGFNKQGTRPRRCHGHPGGKWISALPSRTFKVYTVAFLGSVMGTIQKSSVLLHFSQGCVLEGLPGRKCEREVQSKGGEKGRGCWSPESSWRLHCDQGFLTILFSKGTGKTYRRKTCNLSQEGRQPACSMVGKQRASQGAGIPQEGKHRSTKPWFNLGIFKIHRHLRL